MKVVNKTNSFFEANLNGRIFKYEYLDDPIASPTTSKAATKEASTQVEPEKEPDSDTEPQRKR